MVFSRCRLYYLCNIEDITNVIEHTLACRVYASIPFSAINTIAFTLYNAIENESFGWLRE